MEDFSGREEEGEEKEEATERKRSNSYNTPCNCLRVFLKCLGLDVSATHQLHDQSSSSSGGHDPPSATTTTTTNADEQGMKIQEDEVAMKSSSIFINFIRRPPRPPITPGNGGPKIN